MPTRWRWSWLLASLLVVSAGHAGAQGGEAYFYEIPFRLSGNALPVNGDALAVTIRTRKPQQLAKRLNRTSVEVGKVKRLSLVATLRGADTVGGEPSASDRAASFLVDIDDPALAALSAQFVAAVDDASSVPALIDFVHDRMRPARYAQAFNPASIVARDLTGDCTEHALLLTALARLNGHAARAVLGTMMVSAPDHAGAYGHAWSEIWTDGQWHIADATLPSKGAPYAVHYLPVSAIENEGMGYALELLGIIQDMPQTIAKARIR